VWRLAGACPSSRALRRCALFSHPSVIPYSISPTYSYARINQSIPSIVKLFRLRTATQTVGHRSFPRFRTNCTRDDQNAIVCRPAPVPVVNAPSDLNQVSLQYPAHLQSLSRQGSLVPRDHWPSRLQSLRKHCRCFDITNIYTPYQFQSAYFLPSPSLSPS
jgi:hypothetical protein